MGGVRYFIALAWSVLVSGAALAEPATPPAPAQQPAATTAPAPAKPKPTAVLTDKVRSMTPIAQEGDPGYVPPTTDPSTGVPTTSPAPAATTATVPTAKPATQTQAAPATGTKSKTVQAPAAAPAKAAATEPAKSKPETAKAPAAAPAKAAATEPAKSKTATAKAPAPAKPVTQQATTAKPPAAPAAATASTTRTMKPVDTAGDADKAVAASESKVTQKIGKTSSGDIAMLANGFEAAEREDWTAATSYAGQIKNPVAAKMILWRYYSADTTTASFAEIAAFLGANSGWPRTETMQRNAEKAMPVTIAPDQAIAFFDKRKPLTPVGKLRLGEAFLARGDAPRGTTLVQEAWIEGTYTQTEEQQILAKHAAILTPAIHKQRVDRLLFDYQHTAARRLFSYLDPGARTLADVRIQLVSNAKGAETLLSSVPAELRNDPGLLFAQIRWKARRGLDRETWPFLMSAPTDAKDLADPLEWWQERASQARKALELGVYSQAYAMVENHALDVGVDFAEAEFMAGWIALRFLQDSERAIHHFTRLRDGVTYPISLARANYWLGRACEKAGKDADAKIHYAAGAKFPETFYGQLSAVALTPKATITLQDLKVDTKTHRDAFNANEMTQAIRLFAEIGKERYVRTYSLHFADVASDRETFAQLSNLMRDMGHLDLALRVAKRAMQKHLQLVSYAYPVVKVPSYRGKGKAPEPAFVLGLSRQESEFDPSAVSSAGARGLMQLMPETARRTAKAHGLSFDQAKLTRDSEYNMSLGMAYLSDLMDSFGGSYILTTAAYNAGPGRVREWLGTYGDPRSATMDPIDWMEQIPFSETRNYVQRVIENTQVYRQRLAQAPVPLLLSADIRKRSLSASSASGALLNPPPQKQADATPAAAPASEEQLARTAAQ